MVTIVTAVVALVVVAAEWLHARRIHRVAHLAFGPSGRPSAWVRAVPALRVLSVAAISFGATTLWMYDPIDPKPDLAARASKQMLICLDVSPSMYIADAGPEGNKTTRARWAGRIVQTLVNRLDLTDTRITLIAFYSKAIPVLIDTPDKDLVMSVLDGRPFFTAFEPGETDVAAGVNSALDMARPWAKRSTTLVVVSDGDAGSPIAVIPRPASIADALIIGVGDSQRTSLISQHASRQDAASLKLLAVRLGGTYFDSNRGLLPPSTIRSLHMTAPTQHAPWGDRELGLAALTVGTTLFAGIGPALTWFGIRSTAWKRRRGAARAGSRIEATSGRNGLAAVGESAC